MHIINFLLIFVPSDFQRSSLYLMFQSCWVEMPSGFDAVENDRHALDETTRLIQVLQEHVRNTEAASSMFVKAESNWRTSHKEINPHVQEQSSLQGIISQEESGLEQEVGMHQAASKTVGILSQVAAPKETQSVDAR